MAAAAGISAMAWGTATASATTGATAAAPVTSYSFVSAPGDYIGGGATASYAAPAARIVLSGTAADLTMSVSQGDDSWSVQLAAPRGEQLHPGVYRGAERASFRTGRSPGLDVSGNGRGCNDVWGQFGVDQLDTDANGTVTLLEASFQQHCEGPDAPVLKGIVRYQALPLSYQFTSDAGDFVGAGASRTYTGSTSQFTLTGNVTDGVRIGISGKRDDWTVELAPVEGQRLKPGSYTDAQRASFQEPGHPGLDVSGDSRGCNQVTGSFTITSLTAAADGTVLAIAASFEQHCEGLDPALHGTIKYLAGKFPAA